jgi:hypothetical protein
MSVVFTPQRMRISVDRYEKMVETGVLTKYDRVELIEGCRSAVRSRSLPVVPCGWVISPCRSRISCC